jgi:phenylalanyl-tRNA synthetase beta chain
MRLLVSWLRDFVDVTASPKEIADGLGLRGFEVASLEPAPAEIRPPWRSVRDESDGVIDLEVTANRPDCLGVLGLAREIAALYDLPIRLPSSDANAVIALKPIPLRTSDQVRVVLEEQELCPRYAAAIAEVTARPSPPWLAGRLLAAGVRPINAVVDVSNYVLIELGHPTHAFDLARLSGSELRIRRATPGEPIVTLDGVDRHLEGDMLVIADARSPQAIAGVMGGRSSEVSELTKTVVMESAYFKPASVRRTSRRLGLQTEASFRFERGADISAATLALERVMALLELVGAVRTVGPMIDCYPEPRKPAVLHLRRDRLARLLGASVADPEVERILGRLGLSVGRTADGWDVEVPTFRVDVLREADLIEEVGRHYGFDKLVPTFPVQRAPAPAPDPRIGRDRMIRRVLQAAGLTEAVTFGFVEAKAAEAFRPASGAALAEIANPLSAKFAVLRPSLIPGLIDAVAHNRRHGRRDVRLFEVGARFDLEAGEKHAVALAWTGAAVPEHWSRGARETDFFDLKGVVEHLCAALGAVPRLEPRDEPSLVAGRSASILSTSGGQADTLLGVIGQLAPAAAEARGLPGQDAVFVAELDLDALVATRTARGDAVAALCRQPSVVRDLSILVADTLPAAIIHGTILAAGSQGPAPLVGVSFFDRYQGKNIPEGSVSLSVRLTFQAPDRTLTDAEVQQSFDAILGVLVRDLRAVQR